MRFLRIAGWGKNFENNRTRELKKLDWVPVPNKHDGDGFTELMDHEKGMSHFGAWVLMLQVASKCDPRGALLREGAGGVKTPHTPQSLARISHGSATIFSEAIERLISIGWIETYDDPAPSCDNPAPGCGKVPIEWKGMEGNGMEEKEGNGREGSSRTQALDPFDIWSLDQVIQIASSPDCGVGREMAKACFDCYASKGWVDSNGNEVARSVNALKSLLRAWKAREPSMPRSKSASGVLSHGSAEELARQAMESFGGGAR